jgi:hypothetical protein
MPGAVNPDGLAYLNMARDYAEGKLVVRGAWAPLLPWLITPFVKLGLDPLVGWRIIAGTSGLFWTLSVLHLAGKFRLSKTSKLAVTTAMALFSLRVVFILITPDVISAVVLTWYFNSVIGSKFSDKPLLHGIALGSLGALAYYARHYNLPFVLSHLLLAAILMFLQGRKRKPLLLGIGTALLVFSILVTPWIYTTSARYGYFTIATSGSINRSAFGPETISHPCVETFPCEIPEDVLFPREDPPLKYYPASDWNPFSNEELFHFQIRLIAQGFSKWFFFLISSFGILPFFALLGLPLLILISWANQKNRFLYAATTLTALLYASGYITFGGGWSRYHFPYIPFLLLVGYYLLDEFTYRFEAFFDKGMKRSDLMIYLFLLGIPVLTLAKIPEISSFLQKQEPTDCIVNDFDILADHLKVPMVGADLLVYNVSYQTRLRTYGVLRPDTDPAEADRIMRELGIRSYLALAGSDLELSLLESYDYQFITTWNSCRVKYSILHMPPEYE